MSNNVEIYGKAITCECFIAEYGRYKILGSITDQGIIEIVRGHKNKTIIETKEFMISCPICGFKQLINLEKPSQVLYV